LTDYKTPHAEGAPPQPSRSVSKRYGDIGQAVRPSKAWQRQAIPMSDRLSVRLPLPLLIEVRRWAAAANIGDSEITRRAIQDYVTTLRRAAGEEPDSSDAEAKGLGALFRVG